MFDWTSWHLTGMGFGWLLLLLIVVAIVWLAGRIGARADAGPRESAEEILKRRYAAGAIGREEYERVLADLRK